jgi:hypothetical protein
MEVFVTLGRDFIVAYQNEASARIDPVPIGVSVIKWTFLFSNEEFATQFSVASRSVVRTGY